MLPWQKLPLPQAPLTPSSAEDKSKTSTLSNLGHGAPAGLLYGSLPGGSPCTETKFVRLCPVATADPAVYPWERPSTEGKVVIEITIDERGEIVPQDGAAKPWSHDRPKNAWPHWVAGAFQPATRNGAPISSKQDAIFPFKARG